MIQKIEEYLLVGLAAMVGLLVAALKLQGSRLHKAQVELLNQKFEAQSKAAQDKVNSAKMDYLKALKDYSAAGGSV